jgi:hypothetical protein
MSLFTQALPVSARETTVSAAVRSWCIGGCVGGSVGGTAATKPEERRYPSFLNHGLRSSDPRPQADLP